MLDAQIDAEQEIEFTLKRTKFFDQHKDEPKERQQKVVQRTLDEGHQGFEGGMNARKYISIASGRRRPLQEIYKTWLQKVFTNRRSTRYKINI